MLLENAYKQEMLMSIEVFGSTLDSIIQDYLDILILDYITITRFFAMNNIQRECIHSKLVDMHLNETALRIIRDSLYDVFLSIHLVDNLVNYYKDDLVMNMTSEIPQSRNCINRFITLNCAACTKVIPNLCHSVCGQLALGCFAPHKRVLSDQLNILWNVTAQIISVIEQQSYYLLDSIQKSNLLTLDLEDTTSVRAFVSKIMYYVSVMYSLLVLIMFSNLKLLLVLALCWSM